METAQVCAFTASLLLIVIFLVLTTGCGSVSGGSAATASTTTTAATTTAGATAQLAVNSTSLNFGNVPLDTTSAPQNVTLSNSGASSVTISSISTSTSAFNASGVPAGLVVTPGQTVPLSVTFTPSGPGPETGAISVGTNVASVSITVSGTSHEVALAWTASTTPGITGYNVYRATVPGAFVKPLNSSPIPASTTQFIDTSVQSGQTYYYVVTAVNSLALESNPSNQTLGNIPTP